MLQAGILAGVYMKDGSETSQTQLASYTNEAGPKAAGARALISFQPQASADDVRKFLETNNFAVVDGPRNGYYTVRVAMTGLAKAELAKALQKLQAESSVVRSALPTD
jgi:hypothetical protein